MRSGRGLVVGGLATMVVSVVGVVAAIWWFVAGVSAGIADLTDTPTYSTPVSAAPIELDRGTLELYVIGTAASDAVTMADVTVAGPSGPLPAQALTGSTVSDGQQSFRPVAQFTVPSSGVYALTVGGEPHTTVLVSQGVTKVFSIFTRAGTRVALAVSCGMGFVLGFVLLVIGLVRSSQR